MKSHKQDKGKRILRTSFVYIIQIFENPDQVDFLGKYNSPY
jgi:hypothetical protein